MKDLELVADSLAAETDRGVPATPLHTHAECMNCGVTLKGPYCHACGQSADDHHRSIRHLLWEAVEGFTHLDGRLARTLPALLMHPGRLARDHIEGRRMRHVPPFRMFLISLLIFMFAAEWAVNGGRQEPVKAEHAMATKPIRSYRVGDISIVVTRPSEVGQVLQQEGKNRSRLTDWMVAHIGRAIQNREFYLILVFEWAHRLAILMLPILAGLLTLFYVYKRQFYIYDHLVVAMQYLSFCFLVWAVIWAAPSVVSGVLVIPALIWTPFNLYLILRTAYGSSRIGAGIKAVALWVATALTFGCLLAGLLVFALNKM